MPPGACPPSLQPLFYQSLLHTACSERAIPRNGESVSSSAGPSSLDPCHERGGSTRGIAGQEHVTTSGLPVLGHLPN